jgi:hypothetical protein
MLPAKQQHAVQPSHEEGSKARRAQHSPLGREGRLEAAELL